MIPKVIIQTSPRKPPQYVIDMIGERSPGWEYLHFTDNDVIQFFMDNPLTEFPGVIAKFFSFNYGSHRADLFRYYYLYVKGGVYFDTDAMIEYSLDNILDDSDFFSVNSSYFPGTIFQGFIGCVPGNVVMYEALRDIYFIDNKELLMNFHALCKNLFTITNDCQAKCQIKLFEEVYGNDTDAHVIDTSRDNKLVLIHYHINKIIPPNP